MGTSWSVKMVIPKGRDAAPLYGGIQCVLDQVISEMSTWETGSSISLFNAAPSGSWHHLPAGFFTVLSAALEVARDTGGAYDPTIGPLVDAWGFGPASTAAAIPAQALLDSAWTRVGWGRLLLDNSCRSAFQPGGISLDLSSIAKGFAVDRIAGFLDAAGVVSYLIEVGGELRGEGVKPDGHPWWVALEEPSPCAASQPYVIALHGLSIATSGDYRRFFECDGQRYAHTLDPRTGMPVKSGPASVTVLHASCMHADAFATALTVLGETEGYDFALRHGLAARFLMQEEYEAKERVTPAFAAMLQ